MADDKKVSGWADSLDDEPEDKGVQADIARKILAMNPSMREQGLDTMGVIEKTKQHDNSKAQGAAPSGKTSAGGSNQTRVLDAVADIKKALSNDEKRIETEIARLQKERDNLKNGATEKLVRWLASNDPDLRSPMTQQVLEDEKPFLTRIGFTVKKYVELQRKLVK